MKNERLYVEKKKLGRALLETIFILCMTGYFIFGVLALNDNNTCHSSMIKDQVDGQNVGLTHSGEWCTVNDKLYNFQTLSFLFGVIIFFGLYGRLCFVWIPVFMTD